jgi:hypothetical protein
MFYDIYLYTLCYYICCLLWRMYEMHPTLFLKTGCYSIASSYSSKGYPYFRVLTTTIAGVLIHNLDVCCHRHSVASWEKGK